MFAVPVPVKFGLDFDWSLFLPVAFIYLDTAIETSGDLTANSVILGEPVEGELYKKRIKESSSITLVAMVRPIAALGACCD